jgi:hypothetical protein
MKKNRIINLKSSGGVMKLSRMLVLLLSAGSLQIASAQTMPDSMWIFKDSINDTEKYYYDQGLGFCDTPVINTGCFFISGGTDTGAVYVTDTGNKFDSNYINFSYQFTKGYAGFKMFWDVGMTQFDATQYGAMYLVHKGPLPGHKVQMLWVSSTGCGAPKVFQEFGEFKSSTTWKKEIIPFPAGFKKKGLFELRFLVYNDNGTTSPTSGPGNLKLDNIGFVNRGDAVLPNGKIGATTAADKRFFVPTVSGKVTLTVYSLQGEQLYKGLVDVSAGKQYSVNQFVRSNSKISAELIHCVQITGAGVNISSKTW